jgi:hypothetical protein
MTFYVLFALLLAVAGYWTATQILPERRQKSLVRQGLADGYLHYINQARRQKGLPVLEMDEDLVTVAERKATHQLVTGKSEEGWDYPRIYSEMFGRSLLLEMLLDGPSATMAQRLLRQKDVFDGEWIRCGIGVAGGSSGSVVVALVLCREAWESEPAGAQATQLLAADGR